MSDCTWMSGLLFNHSSAPAPPSQLSQSLPPPLLCSSHLSHDFLLSFWWATPGTVIILCTLVWINSVSFGDISNQLSPFHHQTLSSPLFCFSRKLAFPKHQQPSCPSAHYEKAILFLLAHDYEREGSEGTLLASQVISRLKYWQQSGKNTDSFCHLEQVNTSELWCLLL